MRVVVVAPGVAEHGVVRHAADVVARLRVRGVEVLDPAGDAGPGASADVCHVHFTDALFGGTVSAAADAFVAQSTAWPRPLVVTLHDVPGDDADPERDRRRVAAFQRVVAVADAVVVSSEVEADRAQAWGGARPRVVPLPVPELVPAATPEWDSRVGAQQWDDRPTVGVLGFVYPGKGHAEVLDAAAGLGVRVLALGGASPGHDQLVVELSGQADRLGMPFSITGGLADPALHAAARAVAVPVAASRAPGASASLHTWLGAGRRPVALATPYSREVADRWPGTVQVCHSLREGVEAALADPASTWLAGPPPRPDVAGALLEVYASVLR
jgi:glycosyltransferase involved in cell wall biosynthesis